MKKTRVLSRPEKLDGLDFDGLDENISPDWEHKAEALHLRKFRDLKRSFKGNTHRYG